MRDVSTSDRVRASRLWRWLLVGAGMAGWLGASVWAQDKVPPYINYQGRLLDGNGTVVPNGNYEIAFRIWSAGAGGTLVWGRTLPVNINAGSFNVVLGEGGTAISGAQQTDIDRAFADRERYLGMTVTRDATGAAVLSPQEIAPRQQFLSAPYAMAARDSATLGGVEAASYARIASNATLTATRFTAADATITGTLSAASGTVAGTLSAGTFVGGGTIPAGGIIMWSGAVSQIPRGWVLCDGQNGTPDLRGRFILGTDSARSPGATGGEAQHALTLAEMPGHNHAASVSVGGSHTHTYRSGYGSRVGIKSSSFDGDHEIGLHHQLNTSSTDGEHGHTVTLTPAGGGQPHNNLPPYYVLAFIMRKDESGGGGGGGGGPVVPTDFRMVTGVFTVGSGNFFDTGGPAADYADGEDFVMTFTPSTPGMKVQAVFSYFDTELGYDVMRVYDGESSNAAMIGPDRSGQDSPGTVTASTASGALTFVWHSDGSVHRGGWAATLSCR